MIPAADFPRLSAAVTRNALREGIDHATADDIGQEVATRHLEGKLCRTAEAVGQVINAARAVARRAGTYRAFLPEADAAAKRNQRQRKAEAEGRYRVPVVDRSTMPDPQTLAILAESKGIPLARVHAAYGIGSQADHEAGWTPAVIPATPKATPRPGRPCTDPNPRRTAELRTGPVQIDSHRMADYRAALATYYQGDQ